MEKPLSNGELFFIDVHRNFHFLNEKGYVGYEFRVDTREEQWISYYSYARKIQITIIELNDGVIDVRLNKKSFFNKEISIYDYLSISYKIKTIKKMVEIIRETPMFYNKI